MHRFPQAGNVHVIILLAKSFFDLLPVLTITEMHLKIRERGTRTGGIHHHRTIMTPDPPVSGLIRLNFSQNDIKLVSRVLGTQVFRRSFQPFGCSRRRHSRAAGSGVHLGGCLDSVFRSLRYLTSCLCRGGRVGIVPGTSPIHLDLFHKRGF